MDKILLLEDDVSLIDGLTYSLLRQGYELDVVRTVAEALALLPNLSQYVLLLLDVTLPDGTGFEVCERVRAQNRLIPIIFLTASDKEVSIIRGLDSGDDYMTKPFKLGELWDNAGNYVDGNTLSVYVRRLREKVEADLTDTSSSVSIIQATTKSK